MSCECACAACDSVQSSRSGRTPCAARVAFTAWTSLDSDRGSEAPRAGPLDRKAQKATRKTAGNCRLIIYLNVVAPQGRVKAQKGGSGRLKGVGASCASSSLAGG